MSEHDEPKTALTRLLAGEATKPLAKHAFASESGRGHVWCVCLRWSADRTGSRADDERAYEQHVAAEVAAHLADALLAEGYTTTPAPEVQRLRDTLADVRAQHTETRRRLLKLEAAAPETVETVEHLRARLDDEMAARRIAGGAADRFRDVLSECLGHPDENPGDDVLVAELRKHFGKTGPEPTRWRDFLTGARAVVDQINAMPDPIWVPVDRGADGHEEGS